MLEDVWTHATIWLLNILSPWTPIFLHYFIPHFDAFNLGMDYHLVFNDFPQECTLILMGSAIEIRQVHLHRNLVNLNINMTTSKLCFYQIHYHLITLWWKAMIIVDKLSIHKIKLLICHDVRWGFWGWKLNLYIHRYFSPKLLTSLSYNNFLIFWNHSCFKYFFKNIPFLKKCENNI